MVLSLEVSLFFFSAISRSVSAAVFGGFRSVVLSLGVFFSFFFLQFPRSASADFSRWSYLLEFYNFPAQLQRFSLGGLISWSFFLSFFSSATSPLSFSGFLSVVLSLGVCLFFFFCNFSLGVGGFFSVVLSLGVFYPFSAGFPLGFGGSGPIFLRSLSFFQQFPRPLSAVCYFLRLVVGFYQSIAYDNRAIIQWKDLLVALS